MCSRFQDQLVRLVEGKKTLTCEYPLCKETTAHLSPACPTMHHRCPSCLLRGHATGDCPKGPGEIAEFRDLFERHADLSTLLQKRFSECAWGFYATHPTTARLEYSQLLQMSVSCAQERVQQHSQ